MYIVSIKEVRQEKKESIEDFKDLFNTTKATAGLAASILHYGEITIPELKNYLKQNKIPVRCK